MDIDYAMCSSLQTCLNELVKLAEICGVKCAAQLVVHQVLPSHWQSEDVETVFFGKMIHLAGPITTAILT